MAEDPNDWDVETRLVRGGMARTPYGEMSEALFLNQSFAYESAGAADRRFSGEEPGFIYQRFGNPTTQVFEDRLALLPANVRAAVLKPENQRTAKEQKLADDYFPVLRIDPVKILEDEYQRAPETGLDAELPENFERFFLDRLGV